MLKTRNFDIEIAYFFHFSQDSLLSPLVFADYCTVLFSMVLFEVRPYSIVSFTIVCVTNKMASPFPPPSPHF
jgi:hypothetical protein